MAAGGIVREARPRVQPKSYDEEFEGSVAAAERGADGSSCLRVPLIMKSEELQGEGKEKDGVTVDAVGEEIDEREVEEMREEEEKRVVTAMNMAVKSAGNLANLLPTGTVLCFQFLLPVVSEGGKCTDSSHIFAAMTISLIAVCAATCFLLSFSDTVKTSDGKLYHGFAAPRGMWFPVSQSPFAADLSRYRLRPLDFLHAFLSLTVFLASAFSAPNVVDCLFSADDPLIPSQLLQQSLPLIVGFLASFLCILFPSHRRGYDRPMLERLTEQEAATTH